jgi:hypothetical protein
VIRHTAAGIALLSALAGIAPLAALGAQASSSSVNPPQSRPAAPPTNSTQPDAPPVPTPGGKILFSRGADSTPDAQPATPDSNSGSQPAAQPATPLPAATLPAPPQFAPPPPASSEIGPGDPDPLHVTEAERTALTFTVYDLDLHLAPASAGLSAHAILTVRNDSAAPLSRLILQVSSSLHWDAISLRTNPDPAANAAPAPTAAAFTTRLVDTDADHTGTMSEAVVTLAQPLAPGASLSLIALYSGTIPRSAVRLTRIGAPATQAAAADWDAIAPTDPSADTQAGTALRGFGNVLWVPVSAPPVFLGDGAKLFSLAGHMKLRESAATLRLRLAVEYTGEPPDAAYLCGRRAQLTAISDNPNLPVAEAPGIATATFDAAPIGFRAPSLFITAAAATIAGTPRHPGLLAAITPNDAALPAWTATAAQVDPLLTDWLGADQPDALTILDHPGDPFEDDALLVLPMAAPIHAADPKAAPDLAPTLVHSLTHAWIHSSHPTKPWIDEGLAEFMSLLWTERTQGRAAALAQLADLDRPLALAEPDFSTSNSSALNPPASPAGSSLADASGELFYRNKAAAVWWMLRTIVGDDTLQAALQTYRRTSMEDPRRDRDPEAMEHAIESASKMDLAWFFRDWVYQDRGLPDLRIASVTPSQLQPNGAAAAGWLVAVEVHNDGYAEVEVPVTVRSADAKETRMLRVPGRSGASVRIVFAGTPAEVQVNDGGVPETETGIHTRQLVLPKK